MHEALMSSARTNRTNREQDNWQTPENVLDLVRQVAPIDLDPCGADGNPMKAGRVYHPGRLPPDNDGLTALWTGSGLVFINPPYSRMAEWAERIATEAERTGVRREYIALLPARTDTRWWARLVSTRPSRICFWKGRIKFNRSDGTPGQSAPFPSALLYWGADDQAFTGVFAPHGWIVRT